MKKIYFDVCGTLYSTNTTFHFLIYLHKQEKNYLKLLLCLLLTSPIGKILNKLKLISIRKMMIKTLLGISTNSISKIAKKYVNLILPEYEIKKIFFIFENLVSDDNVEVILVSASIDPVITALAQKYNVNYYSSVLESSNGIFTGKLKLDLKGNKQKFFNSNDTNVFYSDNIDDLPCHKNVDEYYFINRKNINLNQYIQLKKVKNVKEIYV